MMQHRTEYAPACDQPGADPDTWYREDAESVSIAKRLCGGCELQASCLEYAMTFPDEDQWGVWGGLDAAGRRALRASSPDRYPVEVSTLDKFLGTRGERFGNHWENREGWSLREKPIDWAQVDRDELDDRVVSLMERYQNETELGYALTDQSGIVLPVNEVAA